MLRLLGLLLRAGALANREPERSGLRGLADEIVRLSKG